MIKRKKGRTNSKNLVIDGVKFDSKLEGKVYLELKADPSIEILEFHPSFVLIDKFKRGTHNIRACKYSADFRCMIDGEEWVLEVKSTWSASQTDYGIRRKMFLYRYRSINFREIMFKGKVRKITDYRGI